jgi:hypothetical protein
VYSIADTRQGGIQPLSALLELTLQLMPDESRFNGCEYLLFVKWAKDISERCSASYAPDRRLTPEVHHVDDRYVLVVAYLSPGLYAVDGPPEAGIHQHDIWPELFGHFNRFFAGGGNIDHPISQCLHSRFQVLRH